LIEKVLEKGVKTFLVKPFTETIFQERVMKILSYPSNQTAKS